MDKISDTLSAVIAEMRAEANQWRGLDPVNRRTARQLDYYADRLSVLASASAYKRPDSKHSGMEMMGVDIAQPDDQQRAEALEWLHEQNAAPNPRGVGVPYGIVATIEAALRAPDLQEKKEDNK